MRTRVVCALFAVLAATSSARIGETPAECQARYGKPIKVDKEKQLLTFDRPPMVLMAHFSDGKCDSIIMTKARGGATGITEALSDIEMERLLQFNSMGKKWDGPYDTPDKKLWVTEEGLTNGAVVASYDKPRMILHVFTYRFQLQQQEEEDRQKKEREQDTVKRLDGF